MEHRPNDQYGDGIVGLGRMSPSPMLHLVKGWLLQLMSVFSAMFEVERGVVKIKLPGYLTKPWKPCPVYR